LPAALAPAGRVGVRISPHPLARALVRAFGGPITATSANRAGEPPPRSAKDVRGGLAGAVAVVVDGGVTVGAKPSTVVQVDDDGVTVLRKGAIPEEKL
jgi:L-threonylcarbamoyladenylate synthase